MLLCYGLFVFSTRGVGFNTTRRERNWRWAANEPVGAPPALQYLGKGGETFTIEGVLYPEYTAGPLRLDMLDLMASLGQPFLLISGYGHIYGRYVLESISDVQSYHFENGQPQKIEFTIKLRKYAQLGGLLGALGSLISLI